ncbi:hypothetical protein D8X77_17910 [Vibrio vulnificus]|nr:hypothetical protein [Vibrio vulnificus]
MSKTKIKYVAVNRSNNLVTDRMWDTPEEALEQASYIMTYGGWVVVSINLESLTSDSSGNSQK